MSTSVPSFLPMEDSRSPLDDPSDVDTLPDSESSGSSDRGLYIQTDAEREWQESLQQLELLLTMVLIPYVGKYFGRKLAYWSWAKYMTWMYPVEVVVTDPAAFKGIGAIEAASPI